MHECEDCGTFYEPGTGPSDMFQGGCPSCGRPYQHQPSPTHSDMEARNMPAPGMEDTGGNPLQEGILGSQDGGEGWKPALKRDESFASVTSSDPWYLHRAAAGDEETPWHFEISQVVEPGPKTVEVDHPSSDQPIVMQHENQDVLDAAKERLTSAIKESGLFSDITNGIGDAASWAWNHPADVAAGAGLAALQFVPGVGEVADAGLAADEAAGAAGAAEGADAAASDAASSQTAPGKINWDRGTSGDPSETPSESPSGETTGDASTGWKGKIKGLSGPAAGYAIKGLGEGVGKGLLDQAGQGQGPTQDQLPGRGLWQLAKIVGASDFESPSSVPKREDTDDPEKVDPHEVNDGDHQNWEKEFDVNGIGGTSQDTFAGFDPEHSDGLAHLVMLMPLIDHYHQKGDGSGAHDPIIQALDQLLEAESPGYKDHADPQAFEEFKKLLSGGENHGEKIHQDKHDEGAPIVKDEAGDKGGDDDFDDNDIQKESCRHEAKVILGMCINCGNDVRESASWAPSGTSTSPGSTFDSRGEPNYRKIDPKFDPWPDANQWSFNVGSTSASPGSSIDSEHIRDWMLHHYPEVPMRAGNGQGGWADRNVDEGTATPYPETSTSLDLYEMPGSKARQVLDHFGRAHPHEQAFGVIPNGGSSFLHENPHYIPVPEQGRMNLDQGQQQLDLGSLGDGSGTGVTWEPTPITYRSKVVNGGFVNPFPDVPLAHSSHVSLTPGGKSVPLNTRHADHLITSGGPTNPAQMKAVADLLRSEGREQEIPALIDNPDAFAPELLRIQKRQQIPADGGADQAPPEGAAPDDAGPGAGMPMPPPPTGIQPMGNIQQLQCPKCDSHTTEILDNEDGYSRCISCGHKWTEDLEPADSQSTHHNHQSSWRIIHVAEAHAGIPSYDTPLTSTRYAGGSNGAQFAEDPQGNPWLLKQYRDPNQAASELLSNAIYRHMGASAPEAGTHQAPGSIAYPLRPGAPQWGFGQDPQKRQAFSRHYATDALLGNWDFSGLDDDNVLWNGNEPTRIDHGGTFEYRAQGDPKPYGPTPDELWSMLGREQGQRNVAVSEPELRRQAAEIHQNLTPEHINRYVDQAPFTDEDMRERVRQNLASRVNWMGQFGAGQHEVDPQAAPYLQQEPQQYTAADHDINPDARPEADQGGPEDRSREQDSSLSWKDQNGDPLKVGSTYLVYSPKYTVPDRIQIESVKPHGISYTQTGQYGIGHSVEVSRQEADMDGLVFVPADDDAEVGGTDIEQNDDYAGQADPGQQTDLSDSSAYRSASHNNPDLDWLKTAGADFTPMEQRALINEPGIARNRDRLSLENTHYNSSWDNDDDELAWW